MDLARRASLLLAIGLALFAGWKSFARAARETVVLRSSGVDHEDRYTTLWVVDDRPYTWIRAENRTRRWIEDVRANPGVDLRRGGRTLAYRATLFDSAEAQAYVDELFRAKYGLADRTRELLGRRDTLPMRLEPR